MTQGIVIVGFLISEELDKAYSFQELYLLADTSVDVILKMLFLTFSNADIIFVENKLT